MSWFTLLFAVTFTVAVFSHSAYDFGDSSKPQLPTVGYDCKHPNSKIRTISANEVRECAPISPIEKTVQINVQIIQQGVFSKVHVRTCFVKRLVSILQCNVYFDFVNVVPRPVADEIVEISPRECDEMHRYKKYSIDSEKSIDSLNINGTSSSNIFLKGKTDTAGDCKGEDYNIKGTNYYRVIVQGFYTVLLTERFATADLRDDQIMPGAGVSCVFSSGTCKDYTLGTVIWQVDKSECDSRQESIVLYEGIADISVPRNPADADESVLSVTSPTTSFAFRLRGQGIYCGVVIRKTDHPMLFVNDLKISGYKFRETPGWNTQNLDLSIYSNTRFFYIEKHFKENFENLYSTLHEEKCRLERQNLQSLLTLAYIDPDSFAYTFTQSAGYTALVRGEVIYLIECVAVPVKPRTSDTLCYSEIPISYDDKDMFMTSRNRLITLVGNQIECSSIFPMMTQTDEGWFTLYPEKQRAYEPTILAPRDTKFRYKSITSTSIGIYSNQQLASFQKNLLLPAERSAISNNIAAGFHGQPIETTNGRVSNLMDGTEISSLLTSYWSRAFGIGRVLGEWIAFFIGIIAIMRLIVGIVNTLINVQILYKIFGFSWKLLGAFFEALTHAFVLNEPMAIPDQDPSSNTKIEKKKFRLTSKNHSSSSEESPSAPDPELEPLAKTATVVAVEMTPRTTSPEVAPRGNTPLYPSPPFFNKV